MREPMDGSFAHEGTSPQRIVRSWRTGSDCSSAPDGRRSMTA